MSDEPNVDTYVHELVHVAQYAIEGVQGFLGDYAIDFVEGYITGGGRRHEGVPLDQGRAARRGGRGALQGVARAAREGRGRPSRSRPSRRIALEEAQDTLKPPSPISEFGGFSLGGSVGAGGVNRPEDIERVAGRLHGLGFLPTMTTDIEAVTEAIYDYQLRVFRWPRPDSRVDVENKTHRALKAGRKTGSMAL